MCICKGYAKKRKRIYKRKKKSERTNERIIIIIRSSFINVRCFLSMSPVIDSYKVRKKRNKNNSYDLNNFVIKREMYLFE
jgi:hypothetical protein